MRIDKDTKETINKCGNLLNIALDKSIKNRQLAMLYKTEWRKVCNRLEKALHLVQDAQQIIGE